MSSSATPLALRASITAGVRAPSSTESLRGFVSPSVWYSVSILRSEPVHRVPPIQARVKPASSWAGPGPIVVDMLGATHPCSVVVGDPDHSARRRVVDGLAAAGFGAARAPAGPAGGGPGARPRRD